MGRGKIEIKKIDNPSIRRVTFSKRSVGIFKKAKELSILCSADVGVVIFSSNGKLFTHPESPSKLEPILERYHLFKGRSHGEHPNTPPNLKSLHAENERLHAAVRHLNRENLTELPLKDLGNLEDDLKNAISRVRSRKHEIMDQVIQRDEESLKKIREMAGENDVLHERLSHLQKMPSQINLRDEDQDLLPELRLGLESFNKNS